MTYYDKEFKQLNEQSADLKLQNENGQTRWMTVSPQEIEQILKVLNQKEQS